MSQPTTVSARMAQRYDTAANWTSVNPTLLAGEIGIESDTKKWKLGDGSTAWTSLGYIPGLSISAYPLVNADIAAGAEIAVSKLANGTARQLLQTDAAGTGVEFASNIDVPGTLDVTGAATFDNNVILDNQVDARFREATANGTNYVGFQAPASIAADVLWTLPATDGTVGQVLKTDGSGTLDWVSPSVSGPILENQQIIGASYTLSTGYNGVSAGPVAVAATYTVTVPAGAVWVIV